jgi:hypothetical protein
LGLAEGTPFEAHDGQEDLMRRIAIAFVAVATLFTLVSPAMALSPATCSFLGQISDLVGGVIDGVISDNCGSTTPAPGPTVGSSPSGGGNPTVATTEPLIALGVGLGLLGAGLLRRR